MKHLTSATSLLLAVCGASALSGCVTVTKFKDEDRTKVRFAEARAAQIFYDAEFLPHGPNQNGHGTFAVGICLQAPISITTVETKNVAFNQAVRDADLNHNGVITTAEAKAFAKKTEEAVPHQAGTVQIRESRPVGRPVFIATATQQEANIEQCELLDSAN